VSATRRKHGDVPQTASQEEVGSAVPAGEILLYETEDGKARIECRFVGDTLWLSQAQMAELFQVSVPTVNQHLRHLYEDGEILPGATIRKFLIVRREGQRRVSRPIDYFNLDAALAVGYRVHSSRGIQFRQWATDQLREYLVKGFVLDDERLKHPVVPGIATPPDHFDELLERIRDIRASEARMYLRVRDIFALSADYDPKRADATAFFAIMQNKLHVAATGKTAPELVFERADHAAPNMGLTNWKNGSVSKSDVFTAKNYLTREEIAELNRIVGMWLDFAEDQTRRRKEIFLKDWGTKLDEFLRFNDREVLTNAGKVSHEQAMEKARGEYELFAARRRAWREAEGERENVQALEAVARDLEDAAQTKRGTRRRKA